MKLADIVPPVISEELLRLARLDRDWIRWKCIPGTDQYRAVIMQKTWLQKIITGGADIFSMFAASRWLVDGPKIFRPTKQQCEAMGQVAVNIRVHEYQQPYPAILVLLDYPPFSSVLCFKNEGMITCVLHSADHENDITTTLVNEHTAIENMIQRFDDDCKSLAAVSSRALRVACNSCLALSHYGRALRVACNSCLALSHYGSHLDYLLPKVVAEDRRLANEQSDRGVRARKRLKLAVRTISFNQEVTLHRVDDRASTSTPTGDSVSSHWRRGHWAMQPFGPGSSLRKLIFRAPILVRADLFIGDLANTSTVYK